LVKRLSVNRRRPKYNAPAERELCTADCNPHRHDAFLSQHLIPSGIEDDRIGVLKLFGCATKIFPQNAYRTIDIP
jgi:hypothetical protein